MESMLDASAMELSRMIRARTISIPEVVRTHVEHIESVNPKLNAVIATRYEAAMREAEDAQALLMRTDDPTTLPPLLGLPYTAKEYIEAQGMPLSAGIWSRRNVRGERDATIVRRLREAGAILVGITNVPEGGLWLETYNTIHGRTVNPWNARRTAGGSSGGEGAIVSAGGVAFGLGADVGGSIRIPAAFCGTVGHKPTGRLVPNTGFWPPAAGKPLSKYLVCGPLCRRVEDVMPVMRALAGPDGIDTVVRDDLSLEDGPRGLQGVTVHPVTALGRIFIHGVNRDAVRRCAEALGDQGARVDPVDLPRLKKAFPIWAAMMATGGGPDYSEILGNGAPLSTGRELARVLTGRSKHTFPAVVIAGAEHLANKLPGQLDAAVADGERLQAEIEDLLGPRGVLLVPPYSRPAPRHGSPMLTPFDFVCTGIFNVLELPSTVVPVGFDADGLPLSVQVVGRRGADGLTTAVAAALEDAFGGWRRAPL